MKLSLPSLKMILLAACVIVAVVAGGASYAMYEVYVKQAESPSVRRMASALHLPAARVGKAFVGYTDYLTQLDAVSRYLSGPGAQAYGLSSEVTPVVRTSALDRAIRISAVEQLAEQRSIAVTSDDVEHAYDYVRQPPSGATTTREEFASYLQTVIGWEEQDFKQYVIRPALLEDLLKKKVFDETASSTQFDSEFADRLAQKDIVKYLQF
jgi:hypothetical protein